VLGMSSGSPRIRCVRGTLQSRQQLGYYKKKRPNLL
jgi:hypothetical protein